VGGINPQADPAARTLCAVNLDGSGFEVLLQHDGDIFVPPTQPTGSDQTRPFGSAAVGVSPGGTAVVARYGNVERGNEIRIVDLNRLESSGIARSTPAPEGVRARRFQSIAADGLTSLYGVMFLPPQLDETKHYPLIDYIYPGPQIAHAPQSAGSVNATVAESLAALGFVTIMLDTRSTPTRSRAFNQAGDGALLEPQLSDHVAVIRDLCARHGFIRQDRVGIVGQSGGGSAAARALFDYPDVFHVGVSVCGNHNSSRYAATWSDKYRGPGYSAEITNDVAAGKLRGKLLLISGDMDENVHMSQTMLLAAALIAANRNFDLLIVPNAGHGVLMTSGYAQRRVWDYFVTHLLDMQPPTEFEVKFENDQLQRFAARYMKEVMQ
jgi:dipeptidyl aminopeptidase/acylaminoacyl peptidase